MGNGRAFVKGRLADKGVTMTDIARRTAEDPKEVSRIIKKGSRTPRAEPVWREVASVIRVPIGEIYRLYEGAA